MQFGCKDIWIRKSEFVRKTHFDLGQFLIYLLNFYLYRVISPNTGHTEYLSSKLQWSPSSQYVIRTDIVHTSIVLRTIQNLKFTNMQKKSAVSRRNCFKQKWLVFKFAVIETKILEFLKIMGLTQTFKRQCVLSHLIRILYLDTLWNVIHYGIFSLLFYSFILVFNHSKQ